MNEKEVSQTEPDQQVPFPTTHCPSNRKPLNTLDDGVLNVRHHYANVFGTR